MKSVFRTKLGPKGLVAIAGLAAITTLTVGVTTVAQSGASAVPPRRPTPMEMYRTGYSHHELCRVASWVREQGTETHIAGVRLDSRWHTGEFDRPTNFFDKSKLSGKSEEDETQFLQACVGSVDVTLVEATLPKGYEVVGTTKRVVSIRPGIWKHNRFEAEFIVQKNATTETTHEERANEPDGRPAEANRDAAENLGDEPVYNDTTGNYEQDGLHWPRRDDDDPYGVYDHDPVEDADFGEERRTPPSGGGTGLDQHSPHRDASAGGSGTAGDQSEEDVWNDDDWSGNGSTDHHVPATSPAPHPPTDGDSAAHDGGMPPAATTPTEPLTEAPAEPVTTTPTEPVTEAPAEPVTTTPTEQPGSRGEFGCRVEGACELAPGASNERDLDEFTQAIADVTIEGRE